MAMLQGSKQLRRIVVSFLLIAASAMQPTASHAQQAPSPAIALSVRGVPLGMTVGDATIGGANYVTVIAVQPNGPAAAAGLRPGDVIFSFGGGGLSIRSAQAFYEGLQISPATFSLRGQHADSLEFTAVVTAKPVVANRGTVPLPSAANHQADVVRIVQRSPTESGCSATQEFQLEITPPAALSGKTVAELGSTNGEVSRLQDGYGTVVQGGSMVLVPPGDWQVRGFVPDGVPPSFSFTAHGGSTFTLPCTLANPQPSYPHPRPSILRATFMLLKGMVTFFLPQGRQAGRKFEASSNTVFCTVKGTQFMLDATTSGRTSVFVFEGSVSVWPKSRTANPPVTVNAGQTVVATAAAVGLPTAVSASTFVQRYPQVFRGRSARVFSPAATIAELAQVPSATAPPESAAQLPKAQAALAPTANDILDQLNNALAQEASTRAALARELALYAETVRMRVVRGALSQAAADDALRQRARDMAQHGMSIQDQQALRAEQQKETALYFGYIERTVSRNPHWPSGYPAAVYMAEANRLMTRARQSYQQAIAQNRDPGFSLAMAYWVLRLASGDADAVISATPFDSREGGIQAGPASPPGAQSNRPSAPVATLPAVMPKATATTPLRHPTGGSIGIRIKDGTVAGKSAVLIVEVHPGSAGAAVGLRAGDIIVSLEHKPVAYARALHQSVQAFQPGQVVALGLVRAGEPLNVRVKLGMPLPASAVPTRTAPTSRRFENPMVQGMALDGCRIWSNECGQPAADAFCRSQGFASATDFTVERNAPPTRVIGSGQICNGPFCGRIASLTCAGTANE